MRHVKSKAKSTPCTVPAANEPDTAEQAETNDDPKNVELGCEPPPAGTGLQRIQEKASDVGKSLQELGIVACEVAEEQLVQVYGTATHRVKQECQRCSETELSVATRIRQHPFKAVLLACGLGFILGLLKRKSR